jgi:uroporphyrinogen-III decarboxylase
MKGMTQIADLTDIDAGKMPEQLFQERTARLLTACAGRQPDRVPIALCAHNLVADVGGITRQELYDDPEKRDKALIETAQRFQADTCFIIPASTGAGMSLTLGDRMTKWPGHQLGPNQSFQFQEEEFMKAEDYGAFLNDPTDWSIRTYLPRAFKELEPLATLPPLAMASYGFYGLDGILPALTNPAVKRALELLMKAAEDRAAFYGRIGQTFGKLIALGFAPPVMFGPLIEAPFDYMSDTLRGMRGIFIDIRRNPDKLLAAEQKVLDFQLEYAINTCRALKQDFCFIPLHRGSDGFISVKDFLKFYWPQFKEMVIRLVEAGITPTVFWEGCFDQRLEYLAELPKGKSVGWFQNSDIFKVKEVLGDTMCIMGGMKVSMLTGSHTISEIREHTHEVCEVVGKGGGFIMSTDIAEMEGARPELVDIWVQATKEFGKY